MLMSGASITGAAMVYQEPSAAWQIVSDADFNGDGVSDLLWRNTVSGDVYLMPFAPNGFPAGGGVIYNEPNPAWKIIHTPDLDGDGKADIVWWNSISGHVYAMLIDGGAIVRQGIVYQEPNLAWKIVAMGDFGGTGRANQALWRNASTGHVFLMTISVSPFGFAQTGMMLYQEPNTAWKIIAAADLDGDGKDDILWRNDATGDVYAMLMNGTAIAGQGSIYTEPNTDWKVVAQGDYNGDGRADLLWRNDMTGQVYMMLMNGRSISAAAMVMQEPDTAWQILGSWAYRRGWSGYGGAAPACVDTAPAFSFTGEWKEFNIPKGGSASFRLPSITQTGRHAEMVAFQSTATPSDLMSEVTITSACGDFNPVDAMCKQSGSSWSSIDLHAFSSDIGYCTLTPGRKYYVNVRNVVNGVDSCKQVSCSQRLQYFGDLQ
jgi:hypothetical protein